jgi:aspartate-semialdehyde dehydrogenase
MQFGLRQVVNYKPQRGRLSWCSFDIIDNVVPSFRVKRTKWRQLKILEPLITELFRTLISSLVKLQPSQRKRRHLESIFVKLEEDPSIEEIVAHSKILRVLHNCKLPSAPENPIVVRYEKNRPQPRYDRDTGCGMSIVVGRIRKDPIMTFKYMCLGHNTVRGAAGGGILSAELYVANGLA